MKTMPIAPKCASNTFKGLWAYGPDLITDASYMNVTRHRNAYYYPFADETKAKIAGKIAWKNRPMTYHGGGDFEAEILETSAGVVKTLSFTKEEFTKYKNFFGKELPENFKKIEQELKALGLEKYLNRGTFYKIRCFLHRFI